MIMFDPRLDSLAFIHQLIATNLVFKPCHCTDACQPFRTESTLTLDTSGGHPFIAKWWVVAMPMPRPEEPGDDNTELAKLKYTYERGHPGFCPY